MAKQWMIGVLGGSGLYELDALVEAHWISVETAWGRPSDEILVGDLHGVRFAFVPRHGRGHRLPPGAVNSRANIAALKQLGCTDLLGISAVGSFKEDLAPGRFVLPDQFVDRTTRSGKSFFEAGLVAHVSMADPVCARLAGLAAEAATTAGAEVTRGGTYLAIDGPQLSTRAESELYRQWGMDLIGMTAMPEAKLAREAELPYALVGMVTDYDCWKADERPVEVATVIAQLLANAATARVMIERFAQLLPAMRESSPIDTVLDSAIVTSPHAQDPEVLKKLEVILRNRAERQRVQP